MVLQGTAGAFVGLAFVFRVNPHTMYNDFDINLTFLRSLPPTPSPQCRAVWSTSRCSMIRADWRTFGFVLFKLGRQGGGAAAAADTTRRVEHPKSKHGPG